MKMDNLTLDDYRVGVCRECDGACFIECSKCYCLLLFEGMSHNCPEDDDEGYYDELEYVQFCEHCEYVMN